MSEQFLNGTSAHIRPFTALRWCGRCYKRAKIKSRLFSYDKMRVTSNRFKNKNKYVYDKQAICRSKNVSSKSRLYSYN